MRKRRQQPPCAGIKYAQDPIESKPRRFSMTIRRLVIDVLIPHEPNEITYAEKLSQLSGVEGITLRVLWIDEKTKTVDMTIEGEALSFEDIRKVIEELGGSVHSIDRISTGSRIINSKAKAEEER